MAPIRRPPWLGVSDHQRAQRAGGPDGASRSKRAPEPGANDPPTAQKRSRCESVSTSIKRNILALLPRSDYNAQAHFHSIRRHAMGPALAKWQSLTQHPRVVQFFAGLVEHAGVRITDSGEEFTCHHRGGA